MQRNLAKTITSWPFALSLLTLLLNDGWLKAAYPGVLSGKLSDFAGVAVVALLLLTAFARSFAAIYGAMVVAFAWWKSPFSQPFIDVINALFPLSVGRTVDYTDLVALLIIPLCHKVVVELDRYVIPWQQARRILIYPFVAATLFAMLATSQVPPLRQKYVVRPIDHTAELPNEESVAEVISAVAKEHGLDCTACGGSPTTATYRGDDITMSYQFYPALRLISFEIEAEDTNPLFGPSGMEKAERLRSDLKRSLASQFKGLEYVETLDTE